MSRSTSPSEAPSVPEAAVPEAAVGEQGRAPWWEGGLIGEIGAPQDDNDGSGSVDNDDRLVDAAVGILLASDRGTDTVGIDTAHAGSGIHTVGDTAHNGSGIHTVGDTAHGSGIHTDVGDTAHGSGIRTQIGVDTAHVGNGIHTQIGVDTADVGNGIQTERGVDTGGVDVAIDDELITPREPRPRWRSGVLTAGGGHADGIGNDVGGMSGTHVEVVGMEFGVGGVIQGGGPAIDVEGIEFDVGAVIQGGGPAIDVEDSL